MNINKTLILRRLKEYKKFTTDAAFALFLGISPQNLSKWYERNTFDVDKIVDAFPEINTVWLLTGEGDMLGSKKNSYDHLTDPEVQNVVSAVVADEMMKLLLSGQIYSAEVHDKIVAMKDAEIAKKTEAVEKLQRENWELLNKLKEMSK